ncbi:MAG: hypothetical protein C0613_13930 [Desulfobulbaceae bacterium]|nr:MAG: hypothetical protein C0613_13930 [Desulfobulbaceae bacterium]
MALVISADPCPAQEEKAADQEGQRVNKEIKETSKGVARQSKKIFRKSGQAGKSVWQGLREGFRQAD